MFKKVWALALVIMSLSAVAAPNQTLELYRGKRGFLKRCTIKVVEGMRDYEMAIYFYKGKDKWVTVNNQSMYFYQNTWQTAKGPLPVETTAERQTAFSRKVCDFFGWNCREEKYTYRYYFNQDGQLTKAEYLVNGVLEFACPELKRVTLE